MTAEITPVRPTLRLVYSRPDEIPRQRVLTTLDAQIRAAIFRYTNAESLLERRVAFQDFSALHYSRDNEQGRP